jgi:ribosome maturation factor RimP
MQELLEKIKAESLVLLEKQAVELVEITLRREGPRLALRLLVDKPGGISVNECSQINQQIGQLLDEQNLISESYILEVNSPGLDRPLKSEADYRRVQGKLIRVNLAQRVAEKYLHIGTLSKIEKDKIVITKDNAEVEIPLSLITKATLEIEF